MFDDGSRVPETPQQCWIPFITVWKDKFSASYCCQVCVCVCVFLCSYSCEVIFVQEYGVVRLWKVARFDFLLPHNYVLANEC